MVKVRLQGGLGNQLFQYFAGIYFAKLVFTEPSFEIFLSSHSDSDIRHFQLPIKMPLDVNNFSVAVRIVDKFYRTFPIIENRHNRDSSATTANLKVMNPNRELYLTGYYQTYKYFDLACEKDKEFLIRRKLVDPSHLFLRELSHYSTSEFIGVHIRGGDYLNRKSIHMKLGSSYYSRAISTLRDKFNLPLVVFTNDKSYSREILGTQKEVHYFNDQGMTSAEVMSCMSYSKALITANSSFSYWAAIQGNVVNTITPSMWMLDGSRHIETPKSWVSL
jgi:hypothetical protein